MKEDKLLDICVHDIEAKGWKHFSFTRVAETTKTPVSKLYDRFQCRSQVPQEVIKRVNHGMLEELEGEAFEEATAREVIFEILLTRLEVATPYKNFIRVLWKEWPADVLSALMVASQGVGSMGWVLDRAGLNTTGIGGLLRLQGLIGLYLWTVKEWLNDETEDMSKTMATLDQGLERVERIAKSLNL